MRSRLLYIGLPIVALIAVLAVGYSGALASVYCSTNIQYIPTYAQNIPITGVYPPILQTTIADTVCSPSGAVKEFNVWGSSSGLSPSTIEVNKGDVVRITFFASDGAHTINIQGYDVGVTSYPPAEGSPLQFIADKAGTFPIYDSTLIVGTLIVHG